MAGHTLQTAHESLARTHTISSPATHIGLGEKPAYTQTASYTAVCLGFRLQHKVATLRTKGGADRNRTRPQNNRGTHPVIEDQTASVTSGAMTTSRSRKTRSFPTSAKAPACLVAGLLMGSTRSANGLIPSSAVGIASLGKPSFSVVGHEQGQRRGVRGMRPSMSGGGGGGAEEMDSSELYADLRERLEELRREGSRGNEGGMDDAAAAAAAADLRLSGDRTSRSSDAGPKGGGATGAAGSKTYSGEEMKKAYYEAFWRARNLHKDTKFEEGSKDDSSTSTSASSSPSSDTAPPPPKEELVGRATLLTPGGMDLIMTRLTTGAVPPPTPAVQGLTQMYFLEEENEDVAVASAAAAAASVGGDAVIVPRAPRRRARRAFAFDGSGASSGAEEVARIAEPQGMSQMFFLDVAEEEEVAAALPVVAGRSFLSEALGVPGEVVQDLRQVELDHARLAMLAVLLTGAVGAGAGVPAGPSFVDAHAGFSALAEVARTPWLDPCVAGVILSVKALSEGDWRLGKGALAGWADQALRAMSESGAKVLRLSSGDEMRRLALEIEVKHGRMALGAVVCAMAQQGLVTVGA